MTINEPFDEPDEEDRTDYVYDANNRLIQIKKPIPYDEPIANPRPVVQYFWADGRLDSIINENNDPPTKFKYDAIGRLVETKYGEGSTESTEQIWRDEANLVVYRKDRNDIVTRIEYDAAGRVIKQISAYGTDANLLDEAIDSENPSHLQSVTVYSYNAGYDRPYRIVRDGGTTLLAYDYRARQDELTQYPRKGSNVYRKRSSEYVNNMLFKTEHSFDGYTRREYSGYSADQLTVRMIVCRTPDITFTDNGAVMAATRISGPDADFVIADAVRDVRGNIVQLFDAHEIETRNTFDALDRRTASTQGFGTLLALTNQTQYDARGNVTQKIDPVGMITKIAYDPAGNVTLREVAFGTNDLMQTSYTYYIDGRLKTETLPSMTTGQNEYFYVDCCGRTRGVKDPYGHGRITNLDAGGREVHTAVVEDYSAHTDLHNPVNAKTLSEITIRYSDDGRIKYRTVWKTALGSVDPQTPPIAGGGGTGDPPAEDGVTTQYVYFNELNPMLPSGGAVQTVNRLGTGTAQIDISAAITKLAAAPANGGANTEFGTVTFAGPLASGRATVIIGPDEETISVSIRDGMDRPVMNATMTGPAATTPNQLIAWTCTELDQYHDLVQDSFGLVERTNWIAHDVISENDQINAEITSSFSDGFGWNVASSDENGNETRTKFDVAGNPLEVHDRLGIKKSYTYDDLGRQLTAKDHADNVVSATTYFDSTTPSVVGRVKSRTDAKNQTVDFVETDYDILGRLIRIPDRVGANNATVQTYHFSGNLETITDAEGQTTKYYYDELGRKTATTYAKLGGINETNRKVQYDPAGRIQEIELSTDPTKSNSVGIRQVYAYKANDDDVSGTLKEIEFFEALDDANDTPVSVGFHKFQYHDDLRPKRTENTMSGVVRNLAYDYDDNGMMETTETTEYDGEIYTVKTLNDARGRLRGFNYPADPQAQNPRVEYAYTSRGALDTIKLDQAIIEDRGYDDGGRLTSIDRPASGNLNEVRTYYTDSHDLQTISNGAVGTLTYSYDGNKNKTSETWDGVMTPWSFTTVEDLDVGYDKEDRFTKYIRTGSQAIHVELDRGPPGSQGTIGNIQAIEITIGSSNTTERKFNEQHQLVDIDEQNPGGDQTFDWNGNLTTSHNGMTLVWDEAQRLVKTI